MRRPGQRSPGELGGMAPAPASVPIAKHSPLRVASCSPAGAEINSAACAVERRFGVGIQACCWPDRLCRSRTLRFTREEGRWHFSERRGAEIPMRVPAVAATG